MKKKLWFKAKKYGWGWYPSSWQGWAVTGLFIVYELAVSALTVDAFDNRAGVVSFLFLTLLGAAALLVVCYQFGEEPKWRWGNKK